MQQSPKPQTALRMAEGLTPSLARRFFERALDMGGPVLDLTLGDPDVPPPREIREAACEAIMRGKTRYSANAGLPALRESYARFFQDQYGFAVDPRSNVIATVGGMEALFLSLASIAGHGDEVIVLAPYYVNYAQMITMLGGKPVVINRLGRGAAEVAEAIRRSVTDRTVGVIINSPCNPVGDVLPAELLALVAGIAVQHSLTVISDEVYNSLVYDGRTAPSILACEGMRDRAVVIDSCSKRFAMTGWRIGFAVGPEPLIAGMAEMQENIAACAPLPSQHAAMRAYSGGFDYAYIREEYQRRRDIVVDQLSQVPTISFTPPEAAFYCFVDVGRTGWDSEAFACALLERERVAVVPGVAYGDAYSRYIRLAFTLKEDLLREALSRISRFCGEASR